MTHQMFVRYGSNCRLAAMFIAALLLVSAGCDDERVTQAESDAQTAEQRSAVAADAETAEAQRAGFTQDPQAARGVQEAQSETQGLEIIKRLPEQIRLGTPFTYTIAVLSLIHISEPTRPY